MEILTSLRISKIILAILSIVLLSTLPAQAYEHPKQKSLRGDLFFGAGSTSQIAGAAMNSVNSILSFLNSSSVLKRSSFPSNFFFGAGSSAMQIEGASHEGGRGPGVWDDRVEQNKGVFKDSDKFSTMIEHYKRYKEDVQHLKKLGVNSYRMSISWSRVLPDGTLKGGVNQEGLDFYSHLIDELLANGITPFVTIQHFDYPLALQQKLGGFLNHTIVYHYKDYCELLFKTYGDRVKHWTTINEAEVTAIFTYMHSFDNTVAENCLTTKICKSAYTVFHNFLLAHASAAHLYREKFQMIGDTWGANIVGIPDIIATQGGQIGIVLSSQSFVPYSSKAEDLAAAQRLMDFYLGWVLEPLFYGDYPKVMRELVGNRLPNFTEEERKIIKGSTDFIGINYYTSHFARHEPNRTNINGADNFDALAASEEFNKEGKFLGYKDTYGGNYVYPKGLYDVLLYIKEKYQNPNIYITENGIASFNHPNPLKDEHRIAYIFAHLSATKAAIDDGVNVRGYFVWSAFDTFEFQAGYSGNWGLYHVDFSDNLKRVPRAAAEWYINFLTSNEGH